MKPGTRNGMISRCFVWLALLAGCAEPQPPTAKKDAPSSAPSGSAAPRQYVALGDSFTIGTGSSPEQSFPARLRARFGPTTLVNLGVNGYRASDVIAEELPRALALAPDFVTLAVGANDIVRGNDEATYRKEVRTILDALVKVTPRCRILVLPQPDWSRSPVGMSFGAPDELRARIERFNAIIREEANQVGARTIDLFPLMRKQAEAKRFAADGLHPSADAYDEWADAIARALASEPLRATCP